MKKLFSFLIFVLFLSSFFLVSCSKTDNLQPIVDKQNSGLATDEARHGHNCCNCCNCCPATVAHAWNISYQISAANGPLHMNLSVDVFYTNPDAPGTFRTVLRNVNGDLLASNIVPAVVTPAGQTGSFHLNYDVPADAFPCTLHVTGRPADMEHCQDRTREPFAIELDVNK